MEVLNLVVKIIIFCISILLSLSYFRPQNRANHNNEGKGITNGLKLRTDGKKTQITFLDRSYTYLG